MCIATDFGASAPVWATELQLLPAQRAMNAADEEEAEVGGLRGEMMAAADKRGTQMDLEEETDALFHEFTTSLVGFNRPNPNNDSAVAAALAAEAALESAPLSEQIRHKYSQCKVAGVERMGIEAYRRLWALVSRAYPEPDDLSVYEVHENQAEAAKCLLLQHAVELPSRQRLLHEIWQHVAATLRNPQAPSPLPEGLRDVHLHVQTPRSARDLIKVQGRHGAGVSVLLAQLARHVERNCRALGWAGGCHVIYFRALPWHSRSYLMWYLCSAVSMATAVRPAWRALSDMLVRRSQEQGLATVLVLDGISASEALSLADALATARLAGAVVFAVFSPHTPLLAQAATETAPSPIPGALPTSAALSPGGVTAAAPALSPPCIDLTVPEMPVEETRFLIGACLRMLAEAGTGAGAGAAGAAGAGSDAVTDDSSAYQLPASFVALCEERVSYVLERLHHPRAACAGSHAPCAMCHVPCAPGASSAASLPSSCLGGRAVHLESG